MALNLKMNSNNGNGSKNGFYSRTALEGRELLNNIFTHNDNIGAKSVLILGQPGSCKTAVSCSFGEYFINHFPNDKIFWRSALNAPIQIFKLPKWHIYIEKDSGVRLFNRKTKQDITDELKRKRKVTYFKNYNDLYKKAKPGVCNCVFFADKHYKGIKKDEGTVGWFGFIRYLLHSFDWCHVFFDEYQEMVKSGNGEQMWHQIDKHSDDVSTARKSLVGLYANAHQTQEVDYRVLSNFMTTIHMYGARKYKHSMVSKQALGSIKKPSKKIGAEAWISEAGRYGKITFKKVYELPDKYNIEARIISDYEKTKVCEFCGHIFVYKRKDQVYCHRSCQEKALRRKKKHK